MNFFIATFLLIGILGSSLIIAFSEKIKTAAVESLTQIIKEGASQGAPAAGSKFKTPSSTGQSEDKWVPDGFRGPTGEPHIIGPKGSPPGY